MKQEQQEIPGSNNKVVVVTAESAVEENLLWTTGTPELMDAYGVRIGDQLQLVNIDGKPFNKIKRLSETTFSLLL